MINRSIISAVQGKLQTGWQKIGSRTFYFKATGTYGVRGKSFTGWVTIGGNKYYFKRTGDFGTKGMRFQGGYKTIDGKRYYFDSNVSIVRIQIMTAMLQIL